MTRSRCRDVQYAEYLADAGLLGDANAYIVSASTLSAKAKQDARAAPHLLFSPEDVAERCAELGARVAGASAVAGGRSHRSSRSVFDRVGAFMDRSVMKLMGADEGADAQHAAAAGAAHRSGAVSGSVGLSGPPPPSGRPPVAPLSWSTGPRSHGPGSHGAPATAAPGATQVIHRHNHSAPMLPALVPGSGPPSVGPPHDDAASGPSSGKGKGVRGLLTGIASALTGESSMTLHPPRLCLLRSEWMH
jgi:hypothetical protein